MVTRARPNARADGPALDRAFAPLDRRRAFESIVDQVREAIFSGRYGPGARLPTERELAAQFGVARHAVREAIRVLEHSGLVTVRRGAQGGTYVAAATADADGRFLSAVMSARGFGVQDLFHAKLLFEPAVAELVASRASDEDVAALGEIVAQEAASLERSGDAYDQFADFHERLSAVLGNPLLDEMVRALEAAARLLHGAAGPGPRVYRLAHEEHRSVWSAIRRRRPALAQRAMAEHLKAMETRYLRSIAAERKNSAASARRRRPSA